MRCQWMKVFLIANAFKVRISLPTASVAKVNRNRTRAVTERAGAARGAMAAPLVTVQASLIEITSHKVVRAVFGRISLAVDQEHSFLTRRTAQPRQGHGRKTVEAANSESPLTAVSTKHLIRRP